MADTAANDETVRSIEAVVASAVIVALGAPIVDPVVGLVITLVILKITCDSFRLLSTTDPGEMVEHDR